MGLAFAMVVDMSNLGFDAAGRARQSNGWALGAPLIKKCAILSVGNALDQLYAGKYDECCAG